MMLSNDKIDEIVSFIQRWSGVDAKTEEDKKSLRVEVDNIGSMLNRPISKRMPQLKTDD